MKRFVCTGDLPALEARFLTALKAHTAERAFQSQVILCTSHLLGAYLRRQAASGGVPLFNVRFYTFDTLAVELLPLDYQKRKLISPLGELSLLRKIVRTNPGYFAPVQDKDGFWFAILGAIQDLIDGGIQLIPDSLQKARKMNDVARILRSYREAIAPFISRSGALQLATQNVDRFADILGTDSLTAYGFYDFTFLQKQFLGAAAAKLNLTAFLPYRPEGGYAFAEPALAFFRDAGFEVASEWEEPAYAAQPAENDLQRLQARIFQTVIPAGGSPPKSKAALTAGVLGPTGKSYSKKTKTSDVSQLGLFDMAANFVDESSRLTSEPQLPTPDTRHPKPNTQNPTPKTSDPKSETRNPEPETRLPDGTVSIISTADEAAEVTEICRAIQVKVEQGIDFSEMAVVVRNPEVYIPLIIDIFDANAIPYYLQAGVPLSTAHQTKSLLLLLELLGTDFPRSEVIEFANFAPLRWKTLLPSLREGIGGSLESSQREERFRVSPAAWDWLTRKAGVSSGLENWQSRLSALAAQITQELAQAEAASSSEKRSAFYCRLEIFQTETLQEFISTLDRWKQEFGHCRSWTSLARLTAQAMETFFVRAAATGRAPKRQDGGDGKEPADDAIWEQLEEIVDSISTLDQVDSSADLQSWTVALRATLESDRMSAGRFQDGRVSVLSVMGSRCTRHRIVFIPGMTERGFPLTARQDPILLDRERKEINQRSGSAVPLKSLRPREEQLLFHLCVSAAREGLALSFPRLDMETGRPRLPSHYLVRVAEALTGFSHDYRTMENLPHLERIPLSRLGPEKEEQALTENEFALASLTDGRRVPHSLYSSRLRRSLEAYRARWSRAFTAHDGFLNSADSLALIAQWADQQYFSPSRLEVFATCPYRFFLMKLMRLEAAKEPETIQQISPLDRGTLVHDILEEFMRLLKGKDWFPLTREKAPQAHALLDEIAGNSFRYLEEKGVTGYRLLWELEAAQILSDLHTFLEKEIDSGTGFIPDRFEVTFGKGTDFPVHLTLPDKTVLNLSGRIDRIDFDASRGAIRVVDYKTGKAWIDQRGILAGGKKLQLPLYLLAAARLYGIGSLEESVAEYYYVSSAGNFHVHRFPGENWEENRERLTSLLKILSHAIREGRFPPTPGMEKRHCEICDYQLVCDKRVDRVHLVKSSSPELEFQRRSREFT